MVIPGLFEDWTSRLVSLRARVETEHEGPAWLWRIQIRILEYLVARYSGAPELGLAPPRARGRAARRPAPIAKPASPRPAAAQPPRSIGALAPLLRDLVLVNESSRAAREPLDPQDAWLWWRSMIV